MALYFALSRGLKLPLLRLLIVIGLVHLYLRYARNAELLAMLAPLVDGAAAGPAMAALRPDRRLRRSLLQCAALVPPTGRAGALVPGRRRPVLPAA